MVQEGDFVNKGTPVAIFEDTRKAEIVCNLTPADLNWIRSHSQPGAEQLADTRSVYRIPKTEIEVFDPAEDDVIWTGTLERFDGIGRDEMTRTIPCRIVVDQPIVKSTTGLRALVRGMYVKCRIKVQTSANQNDVELFRLPEVSLQPDDTIWLLDSEQQLRQVEIEVVDSLDQVDHDASQPQVIVRAKTGELNPGDQVVISPLSQPTVGAKVILRTDSKHARDILSQTD